MRFFRLLFQRYIQGSFHVALMALCYFQITHLQWNLQTNAKDQLFVFCLTFLAYNGIKHMKYIIKHKRLTKGLAIVKLVIFLCVCQSIYVYVGLATIQQVFLGGCFLLTVAYAVPLPYIGHNLRSQTGLKIFIVALCWTLLSAVFPLLQLGVFGLEHYLFFFERFVLIFLATLPFEISDLHQDDSELGTIPQLIGVKNTKRLGFFLIAIFWAILLLNPKLSESELLAFSGITIAYGITFFKIHPNSSKYITLFWVEAIPLIGVLLYQLKF